jgi:sterol desaturase/sphingolipid hydroxylase (fatty acid hydroxylase superfamily)
MPAPANLHYPINHDPEPIRLFKSDFLEFFTHITPLAIVIIWLPVILASLLLAIIAQIRLGRLQIVLLGFLAGLFVWSFSEYILHRFVFHFRPHSARQERIVFLFHGVHHAQPDCKTRLVMPPVVSIPLALGFFFLFQFFVGNLLGGPGWVYPLFAGFGSGYLIYDLTHYATHHSRMQGRMLKYLKRHHMLHHYKTPDARYGVSSPLWDVVFKTLPTAE